MLEGRGSEYGVVRMQVDDVPAAVSLVSYLSDRGISNTSELLKLGSIYLNEVRVENLFSTVCSGDHLRIHTQPRRYSKPEHLRSRIVETTEEFYVINKPCGLPVHSQVDNSRENLITFLEEELREELFVTHRLDIETSGCLLVARTLSARSAINRLFREHLIGKHYVAQVEKFVEPQTYVHFMKPSFTAPKEISSTEQEGWLRCELKVVSCNRNSDGHFDLLIQLITGRPQQIRAQLAYLSSPILGDKKYGSTVSFGDNCIALRCSKLLFDRKLIAPSSASSPSSVIPEDGD